MARTVQALRICRRKLDAIIASPDAAGRDRGLPPRPQRARIHPQDPARDRPAAGDHPARGGGAPGGDLLRAAGAPETEQLLVIDIGGGSTELVWIDLSGVAPEGSGARR
jgi:exopolyphosphatase / guanosine-5'-triphosphate,3'-diphosphate pyrophosphatase